MMNCLIICDSTRVLHNLSAVFMERGDSITLIREKNDVFVAGKMFLYDLLIVDMHFQDFDALDFLERHCESEGPIPTIVLSATPSQAHSLWSLGFREDFIVPDPQDTHAIIRLVSRIGARLAREKNHAPDPHQDAPDRLEPLEGATGPLASATTLPWCPPVIVVAGHKGGTGKSTVAMHLIAGLLNEGYKVSSFDLDHPQISLTRYLENRRNYALEFGADLPMPDHRTLMPDGCSPDQLKSQILAARAAADVVVVDCAAGQTPRCAVAIELASCLVTVINDSFVDLDLIARVNPTDMTLNRLGIFGQHVAAIRKRRRFLGEPELRWLLLRNRLSTIEARNKVAMSEALDALAPRVGFTKGQGLSERVIYRELFLKGLTLYDLRQEGVDERMSLSHVGARQELRTFLDEIRDDSEDFSALEMTG